MDSWIQLIDFCLVDRIMQMKESGLMEYWRRKHFPSASQHHCNPSRAKSKPRNLTLNDIQSAFLIWAIGLSLALTFFLAEFILHKMSHKL